MTSMGESNVSESGNIQVLQFCVPISFLSPANQHGRRTDGPTTSVLRLVRPESQVPGRQTHDYTLVLYFSYVFPRVAFSSSLSSSPSPVQSTTTSSRLLCCTLTRTNHFLKPLQSVFSFLLLTMRQEGGSESEMKYELVEEMEPNSLILNNHISPLSPLTA